MDDQLEVTTQTAQSKSSAASLPAEIVDYVVDFLYDDVASLRACTLAGRQWLPASSFHLFRRISWPPCDAQADWTAASHRSNCAKCHLIGGFGTLESIATLLKTSVRVSRGVRELYIKMEWHDHGTSIMSTVTTTPQQLAHIVSLSPFLETLDIQPLHFNPSSSLVPLPVEPSIRTLRLKSPPTGINLNCMLIFLSHFSNISTLALSPVISMQKHSALSVSAQTLLIRAKELDIVVLSAAHIWFEFLSSHLDLSYLTSLSHSPPSFRGPWAQNLKDSIPAVHDFLRKCSNLRSLTCRGRVPAPGILSYPSACSTLSELHYHLGYIPSGTWSPSLWSHLADLLKCPLASTVTVVIVRLACTKTVYSSREHLDFTVHQTDFEETFGSLNWPVLNAAITRLQVLRMKIRLSVWKGQREWERIETSQENAHPEPAMWRSITEMCRTKIEAFVRSRLSLASHQKLELDVSIRTKD